MSDEINNLNPHEPLRVKMRIIVCFEPHYNLYK